MVAGVAVVGVVVMEGAEEWVLLRRPVTPIRITKRLDERLKHCSFNLSSAFEFATVPLRLC
jgi:hypothetical protein